jgi:hypothetical protein
MEHELARKARWEGPMSRLMTVGELSRRAGVPIKNLREYTDTA